MSTLSIFVDQLKTSPEEEKHHDSVSQESELLGFKGANEDNLNPRVRHYFERGNGLDELFEFDDTNIMKDEEMQTEADMSRYAHQILDESEK